MKYFLWGMKEPDYIMRMMVAGGPLTADESCRTAKQVWKEGWENLLGTFQYTWPFDWHFKYRNAIDDHINLCHAVPAIEESSVTKHWECHVFAFLLALSEINAFLALCYFVFGRSSIEGCPTLIEFRWRLAWQLINNPWLRQEEQEAA
jgi:hypothetical protein